MEHDDDDLGIPSKQIEARVEHEQNPQRKNHATKREKVEKEPKKRKQNGDVAGMMKKYLALRTKQAEEEAAELARERAEARTVDDFSIKRCISVVNTMEELSIDEKVNAFEVFKNDQNREIFLSADPMSRLMWLRRQMG